MYTITIHSLVASTPLDSGSGFGKSSKHRRVPSSIGRSRKYQLWYSTESAEKSYQRSPDISPGCVGCGADFVYYDPRRRCDISETEGLLLPNVTRHAIPDGHRTGWSFDNIPDSWQANAQAVEDNREGWDEDISTGNVNGVRTGESGPSKSWHVVSPQRNWVDVQGMGAHEDEIRICNMCESTADVVCRFFTQMGFHNDKFGESWAEMLGYMHAFLLMTSSNAD